MGTRPEGKTQVPPPSFFILPVCTYCTTLGTFADVTGSRVSNCICTITQLHCYYSSKIKNKENLAISSSECNNKCTSKTLVESGGVRKGSFDIAKRANSCIYFTLVLSTEFFFLLLLLLLPPSSHVGGNLPSFF